MAAVDRVVLAEALAVDLDLEGGRDVDVVVREEDALGVDLLASQRCREPRVVLLRDGQQVGDVDGLTEAAVSYGRWNEI